MSIPQYAKTTDPEVVATVAANLAGEIDSYERSCAWATKHGAPKGEHYAGTFMGHRSVSAIASNSKPAEGQWTRGRSGGWRPFANNPLSKEMRALGFQSKPIPGLPEVVHSREFGGGQQYVTAPKPFVHDGVAYLGFRFELDHSSPERVAPQNPDYSWTEIKASEYHAAAEAYDAARKAAA